MKMNMAIHTINRVPQIQKFIFTTSNEDHWLSRSICRGVVVACILCTSRLHTRC
jgi:hypothetical protein